MKKILCLVMAAVLAVVMMEPMKASAATTDDLSIYVRGGNPTLVGSVTSYGSDDGTLPIVSYEVVLPVTFEIANMPVGDYVNGRFSIKNTLSIDVEGSSSKWSAQLVEMSFNRDGLTGYYYTGKSAEHGGEYVFTSSGKLASLSDVFGIRFDESFYVDQDTLSFVGYFTYQFTLYGLIGSSDTPFIDWTSAAVEQTSYGLKFEYFDFPPEKSWLMGRVDKLSNDLISTLGTFQTAVENKFQTLFTFGRQWTDDIIDAIVGQGGGSGTINSAQDKLDQQLNNFEAAENQIADQVVDKIEIPTLVLNDSQASALSWVIGMINTWYLEFSELQILFGSVMFFGIIGVVLFGRRSL